MHKEIKETIKIKALESGFNAAGFAAPNLSQESRSGLEAFLASGNHGDMTWMQDKADRRADPLAIWPQAKTIIMLGHNYGPETNPLEKLEERSSPNISCYALNKDYHDVIKKKLKALARWMISQYGGDARVYVDTAPVMEKPLAQSAGLGWQGKHTCIVSRQYGSWLFLGSIFTDLEIEPDAPESDHCGSCTRCLDICPTQAFTAPRQLDARRCISYLTIEHKGQIPEEFRAAIGNRIYGCDDCLAVCPWNKYALAASEIAYKPRESIASASLAELAALDDAAFRERFSGSPVKRIGRDRFVRNVLIAIGNSGNPDFAASAALLTADASPLVAEMAVWALRRLTAGR